MNKDRRERGQKVIDLITDANALLAEIADEEQSYFDEMPENLQAGERGERAEEVATELLESSDTLTEIISTIEGAIE